MNFSFVKKAIALAAVTCCAPMVFAQQSSVQLYGIVDAAVRHTNNEGANKGSKTQMIGGGMSQSRWGINVTEDLGGGLAAIANVEARFLTDSGESASTNFFQQSWVGLRSKSFGQVTMGRQYNMLFDLVTSTYASFPYSPYMEAYKPEIGMSMGARASNMIKYVAEFGPVRGGLQYSFDENNTFDKVGAAVSTGGAIKTAGGYLRYSQSGISAGAGYLTTTLPAGTKVDAWSLGGSYRVGNLYLNAGYGLNKRKDNYPAPAQGGAFDQGILNAYWTGSSNGGFSAGDANKRQMYKVGAGYQVTPQVNIGAHYYHAKQSGSGTGNFNGKADFIVAVADYAFSKRTDAYVAIDHTKVSGGNSMNLDANGATKRTGFTVGLRHRF
ncbi:porin [Comamonas composti]|uniref:porin n=1 Tax=Comamonas composti TaxID=408558 RepID=UPI000405CCE2|nr:porin [Comamonas composti]